MVIQKKQVFVEFNTALEHLRSDTVSPSMLGALSGANRTELAAFAVTWVDLPVERRQRISQMLVELAEEDFKHDFNVLFRYMLNDEDARVRAHAIDGLWEDEDTALIKPLVGFLRSDPNAGVRAAAADSLGRFVLLGEYDRIPQQGLTDLLHDALLATIRSGTEENEVRARAIESLAYWSEEMVRDIISAAYEDEDAILRAAAIAAMGRSADTFWRKTAAGELESPDPRMRYEAAVAVGELEDKESVPRLIELMDDPDREVQGAAITSLGQIGGKTARQALQRAAESDDEIMHALADEALQELEFSSGSELLLLDLDGSSRQPGKVEGDLDDEDEDDDWDLGDEDEDGDLEPDDTDDDEDEDEDENDEFTEE